MTLLFLILMISLPTIEVGQPMKNYIFVECKSPFLRSNHSYQVQVDSKGT